MLVVMEDHGRYPSRARRSMMPRARPRQGGAGSWARLSGGPRSTARSYFDRLRSASCARYSAIYLPFAGPDGGGQPRAAPTITMQPRLTSPCRSKKSTSCSRSPTTGVRTVALGGGVARCGCAHVADLAASTGRRVPAAARALHRQRGDDHRDRLVATARRRPYVAPRRHDPNLRL
jgi:hypothetical protein